MPEPTAIPCPADDRVADSHRGLMKATIHPQYSEITATCSCGNKIQTRSTLGKDLTLDVCAKCHPFYTGKQREATTGGRVNRFKQRFGSRIGK